MEILKYKVFESNNFNKKFRNVIKSMGVIDKSNKVDLKDMIEKINSFLSNETNKKNFLEELKEEIKPNVKVDNITVKCKKLKPSQNAIYLDNVIPRIVVKDYEREQILQGELKEHNILISSDNHIIDGHHRWAGIYLLNPECKIHLTMIKLPIDYALPLVNAMMEANDRHYIREDEKFKLNIYEIMDKPKEEIFNIINDLIVKTIKNGAVIDGEKETTDEQWEINESIEKKYGINTDTTESFYKDIKKKLELDCHPLKWIRKNMKDIPIPKKRFASRDEMPHLKERDARSYL